jgi:hypothetical protein
MACIPGDWTYVLKADAHRREEALARKLALLALAAPSQQHPAVITARTALSANTHPVPTVAISAPACMGPKMRDVFMDTALSAIAEGSSFLSTSSGRVAAYAGQRRARPMPLANVSASSTPGASVFVRVVTHSRIAVAMSQNCVKIRMLRRSTMSASAPLGTPRMKTGNVDAVCTRATISGEVLNEVMSHAAATSFIHMHKLASSHPVQRIRNTGLLNGVQAEGRLSATSTTSAHV